ncbi:TonB-denpendent receptor [Hyphomicrobium nitrativorans NL23]|uniref:TonB-denpendent receptor n=1 Tax=Hyphomicrobium nitrativorans NL23 TaxID=1029756 RepID=V5SB50_9HYPH|nr:TonB-denpendent receptor [Hyphomicrobium nitrativorans NL23]
MPAAALFAAAAASATITHAQETVTDLPEIEVTSPSPVRKQARRPSAPAASTQAAPVADFEAPLPDNLPGTLIVSDDTFSSVTVVTDRDVLSTSGQTITEALQTRPGIIGSTFAPGANRPIIRGLDSYRVRTQENGIGTHDVAAISEDHAVPIDPNAGDRVEVIRGPATLRYGSQAIGGVVSVENQRIPTFIPRNGFSGAIRGAGTSVDEGKDGSFKATAGSNGFAVHADGFWRKADDYDSPRGTVVNSFVESKGGALGASLIGLDGFFGVSFSRIESTYGIPGHEAEEGVDPYIDLVQDRYMAHGEWRVRDAGIEAIRFWFGASNYRHNEWAKHDHGHGGHGHGHGHAHDDDDDDVDFAVHSRFKNTEQEARLELQHLPVGTSLGTFSGALGVHVVNRDTSGIVPDPDAGESLLEPAHTQSVAAFWFEELEINPFLRLQAAARIEHTTVDGKGWSEFEIEEVPHGNHSHFHLHHEDFKGERSFTPVSGSLGLLQKLPFDVVGRLTGSYVERAPDAAELFSKGMHEATGTFEVGNPFLDVEKATTAEVGLAKARGAFRFDASAYYTRYNGFIYRALQGYTCEADGHECEPEDEHGHGHGHGHGGAHMFDLVHFQQRDANFYGAELAFQYDVAPIWNGLWGIEGQYDFVHAKFDGGGYVPRIPPHRLGGGIYYRDANWFARAGVLHAFDQNRFGEEEEATPGYTLVSAELSYTIQGETVDGIVPVATIGIRGENLADDEVLNHTSFKRREDVLLPGANVRVFGSINLN